MDNPFSALGVCDATMLQRRARLQNAANGDMQGAAITWKSEVLSSVQTLEYGQDYARPKSGAMTRCAVVKYH